MALDRFSAALSVVRRWVGGLLLICCLGLMLPGFTAPAWAGLNDDNYDGNIFALYAGNGSIVPPRQSLSQSLAQGRATILVIYIEDSADCKRYTSVISQLQAPYGRVANFVPIMADSIPVKDAYEPDEPGYYFDGIVPKTVVFSKSGDVMLETTGETAYEDIDDVMREIFDLLPRTESVELKRRPINEVNSELVEPAAE